MIPTFLRVSGFLSYLEPVEIDFSEINLACISGANGAGKSSLLDAITWAVFGKARGRDEMIIHSQKDVAEVILDFDYEGRRYRVQRSKERNKSVQLNFYIQDDQGRWVTLTESTLRGTEAAITKLLHLDYETFVNASFFLQGKADSFAQQRPADRKRILINILGLEIWEEYRTRAVERRKQAEGDLRFLDAQLKEIDEELSQEESRKIRLKELEKDLHHLSEARQSQEKLLEGLRITVASFEEQKRMVDLQGEQAANARKRADQTGDLLAERKSELEREMKLLDEAEEIQAAYTAWQKSVSELEHWNEVGRSFHEVEKKRRIPMDVITTERGRLEGECQALLKQEKQALQIEKQLPDKIVHLERLQQEYQTVQDRLRNRGTLEEQITFTKEQIAGWNVENTRLKQDMEELKKRMDQLEEVTGAECPLCGQPLDASARERLLGELQADGTRMGDCYRENQLLIQEAQKTIQTLEEALDSLRAAEVELTSLEKQRAEVAAQKEQLELSLSSWQESGAVQLVEVTHRLGTEDYAADARADLAVVDAELKSLGYDATAHDKVRREEQVGRASQERMRQLDTARARMEPLTREIAGLENQLADAEKETAALVSIYETARKKYEVESANLPDLPAAERDLRLLREQENQARDAVGGARNEVDVLTQVRTNKVNFSQERTQVAERIGRLKQLEVAFGKNGIPALFIDEAMHDLEEQANQVLDRLSYGTMSVRFPTQRDYKDKKRSDKQETLDILISDTAGTREYEMFSGGEAFRINFAIRLALSRVLAQRAGARLQILVVDEGFGSQDSDGRQRLIEAINLVRDDFVRILVITHLEEMKDVFPTRIEVEKTNNGSQARVVTL